MALLVLELYLHGIHKVLYELASQELITTNATELCVLNCLILLIISSFDHW